MTNQSELYGNLILDLNTILHNHFQGQRKATVDGFANAQRELATYITANYTPNSEVEKLERDARVEELTGLLSMQKNKPKRVLLKDAVNIAYSRVCELTKNKEEL